MCELLTIVANQPVAFDISWRAFQHRARFNPHGWGVAYRRENLGDFVLEKKPEKLPAGQTGLRLILRKRAMTIAAHTRFQCKGPISLENTQPFVSNDKSIAFIATMTNCLISKRFAPAVKKMLVGDTGTEVLFRLLLDNQPNFRPILRSVFKPKKKLSPKAKSSFVLIDSTRVLAFRFRKPLYSLTRTRAQDKIIQIRSPRGVKATFNLKKSSGLELTLLATEPLTNEDWMPLVDQSLYEIGPSGCKVVFTL